MKTLIAFILGALLAAGVTYSVIQSSDSTSSNPTAVAEETTDDSLIANIRSRSPQFQNAPISVMRELSEYGFTGFYEISIGGQHMVVNSTGDYAVVGDLFQLDGITNLSLNYRNEQLSAAATNEVANLSDELTIDFPANTDTNEVGTLYVFTDPTCPYCQRLHNERSTYAAAGVNIRYIPYPRSGLGGGKDYQQLVEIMCADDKAQALTAFKDDPEAAARTYSTAGDNNACRELVRQGFEMGQRIGISGTPFIIKSSGGVIPGYNPARSIINQLSNN